MRDSALKHVDSCLLMQTVNRLVGEELMRDSALKLINSIALLI